MSCTEEVYVYRCCTCKQVGRELNRDPTYCSNCGSPVARPNLKSPLLVRIEWMKVE